MAYTSPQGNKLTHHQALRALAIQIWQVQPTATLNSSMIQRRLAQDDQTYEIATERRITPEDPITDLDHIRPWLEGWLHEGFAKAVDDAMCRYDMFGIGQKVWACISKDRETGNDEACWGLIMAGQ